ncbi:hypothetical protein [Nostoc sp. PCC 7107]|uniref:hypothetical protein n=1 Tax=Nostoc sp. PCC 7107 TaxID=317936 RepID=UPI00029F46F3|nr:hypothetical protein [Nostoc sp. PCC 7107]AFY45739.1 hypothetical protein Nos7107_5238 [Nostoc sp. PCC 7107]
MNSQDPTANNTSEQPHVIVVDEFAAISKSLEEHSQRQEILEKIQEYQSQVLRAARNKED